MSAMELMMKKNIIILTLSFLSVLSVYPRYFSSRGVSFRYPSSCRIKRNTINKYRTHRITVGKRGLTAGIFVFKYTVTKNRVTKFVKSYIRRIKKMSMRRIRKSKIYGNISIPIRHGVKGFMIKISAKFRGKYKTYSRLYFFNFNGKGVVIDTVRFRRVRGNFKWFFNTLNLKWQGFKLVKYNDDNFVFNYPDNYNLKTKQRKNSFNIKAVGLVHAVSVYLIGAELTQKNINIYIRAYFKRVKKLGIKNAKVYKRKNNVKLPFKNYKITGNIYYVSGRLKQRDIRAYIYFFRYNNKSVVIKIVKPADSKQWFRWFFNSFNVK